MVRRETELVGGDADELYSDESCTDDDARSPGVCNVRLIVS